MAEYYNEKDKDNNEHKPKISVALEYTPGEEAPKIIASGKGALAERIIDKAKEADVPVYQDSKLANTLSKLEIGDMIPPELYGVVAEILVFVDECDRIRGKVKHWVHIFYKFIIILLGKGIHWIKEK